MAPKPANLTDAEIVAIFGITNFAASATTRAPESDQAAAAIAPAWGGGVGTAPVLRSHWSLDAWLVARAGAGDPGAPQLGGGQTGARLAYAFGSDRRGAAYVRVSKPLARGGTELALGAQWRPTALPVVAFVEARRREDGATVPAAGVAGGVYRQPLWRDFRLDGYGQAGAVGGRAATRFVEGQVRVSRGIGTLVAVPLDVGIGTWGGAQRGASRLDVGPSLGIDVPIGRPNLRLTLDWRQRVAGRAAPASGPVLTIGAGF